VYGASSWRPVTLTPSAAADADVVGVVAVDSDAEASAACLAMESGRGSECLTMAPYKPYSAMTLQLDRLHAFSVLRHLARRFWNQTFVHSETS